MSEAYNLCRSQQYFQAVKKHQHVLLAFHIPAGIDVFTSLKAFTYIYEFWYPEYTHEFEALLNEYANTITGVLSAHIHMDSFQLLTVKKGNPLPVIFTSSISPIFGNNPAFKVFSYESKTLQLKNYDTYFYPLDKLHWQHEYSFNHIYQPVCHGCNLSAGLTQLMKDKQKISEYKKYYAAGHNSQFITEKQTSIAYYWCNIFSITSSAYRTCLSKKPFN